MCMDQQCSVWKGLYLFVSYNLIDVNMISINSHLVFLVNGVCVCVCVNGLCVSVRASVRACVHACACVCV